ncbi:hypothetical protein QLQ12_24075 [Actinoplanes sp. NEAU-A12]|uniref:Lipoprotein n=1 Tax=Actinoplanes sandaracinus TaxID=3045177 RepID=A0ABT6WPM0_9ACTN|nr:hypothetical protein [Actinoplanes sandaracinus]MDI6101703.1 hypothetical protein [Actinoplanes sandaracinus]
MSLRPPLYAVPMLLLVCACGSGEPPRPPADPAAAIVEVDRGGGLAAAVERWTLPNLTLFGDGTAVLRGETRGGLLSGVRRTIPAGRITELYRLADRAGLFTGRTHDRDIIDGEVLTVRIADETGIRETTVVGPSDDEDSGRGGVVAFADAALGSGSDAGEYLPERYAVLVTAGSDARGDVRPWPLAAPLSQLAGAPSKPCQVVERGEAEPLLTALRDAGPDTRWEADGHRVVLVARPLLPGEQTCADL